MSDRNEYWMTKDGQEIAIKDMSNRHILNCISHIIKNGIWDVYAPDIEAVEYFRCEDEEKRYIGIFVNELKRRGFNIKFKNGGENASNRSGI